MNAVLERAVDFRHAKSAVSLQWDVIQRHPIFRTEVSGDELWAAYLGAFPPGTNRVFRERTEHDCSCCRHFIRDVGNAVAVVDGELVSVWDGVPDDPAFEVVFAALARLVKSKPIASPYLHSERFAGVDKNFERKDGEAVKTWNHFHVQIPQALHMKRSDIATALGERQAAHDVLERGLRELTLDAIDAVLDMIGQNSLYRGEEHKGAVTKFRGLKVAYDALLEGERSVYVWLTSATESPAIARIRNTAIGSLLVELSAGVDLEDAVKSFEAKVAPSNYKRPTALVTKAMVEKARAAVAELGLTSALERRHAVVEDLKIEDLLFVDRSTRAVINGDAFDVVASEASSRVSAKSLERLEDVPVERFIAEVLPRAESVEVLLENRHASNLVSLIAPVNPGAGLLFKWPNAFSWSYVGELADSIRERVKRAGGSVEGDLCCRLGWYNHDDLDFHMHEPGGGHIYFASHRGARGHSPCGGLLDVDMNAGSGTTREPVENIFYADRARMRPGEYRLAVNQWARRENRDHGFEVEVDVMGTVHHFASAEPMPHGKTIEVATIRVSKNGDMEVIPALEGSQRYASRKLWCIDTGNFHRVKAAMLSPNHWGAAAGNKHLFFMLEGCASDAPARGFYNEFLTPALDVHRKVLEVVGSKAAVTQADRQLSGLGFSSTQRNSVTCRIKGGYTRTINVTF